MNRRLALPLAVLVVAGLGALPAEAAKPKKKPKPITGSYTLNLPPDPSKDVTSTAELPGCSGLLPTAINKHPFTLPAAGTLTVKLAGEDPAKGAAPAGFDWDLYLVSSAGIESESDGATGQEEAVMTVKKKTSVTFDVCNLNGTPNAVVTYTFTYK